MIRALIAIFAMVVSVNVYAQCAAEAPVLRLFIGLNAPIGQCDSELYFPNGQLAYSPGFHEWYHQSGHVAFSTNYQEWYYDNGKLAYSKNYLEWYHPNGHLAYSNNFKEWYYDTGRLLYSDNFKEWYHSNGRVAYSSNYGELYYTDGRLAGKMKMPSNLDMIEFVQNQSCPLNFNILCAIAMMQDRTAP